MAAPGAGFSSGFDAGFGDGDTSIDRGTRGVFAANIGFGLWAIRWFVWLFAAFTYLEEYRPWLSQKLY